MAGIRVRWHISPRYERKSLDLNDVIFLYGLRMHALWKNIGVGARNRRDN